MKIHPIQQQTIVAAHYLINFTKNKLYYTLLKTFVQITNYTPLLLFTVKQSGGNKVFFLLIKLLLLKFTHSEKQNKTEE